MRKLLRLTYLPLLILTLVAAALTARADTDQKKPFYGDSKKALTGNLKTAALLSEPPAALKKKIPKGANAYSIDLDSDGKPDFIVKSKSQTCFLDSNFKQRSCTKAGYAYGFDYVYFAQLDEDPTLEVFDFVGDEDSSDYKLLKLDSKTWKLKTLTKFHPLMHPLDQQHKGLFWGYPWDITDLPLKQEGGTIRFGAVGNFTDAEEEAPAIFFAGVPTQGNPNGTVNEQLPNEKWVTLKELLSGLKKPAK